MKKFTAIVLILLLILSLAACGPKQPVEETPDPGVEEDIPVPTPTPAPVEDPAVAYTATESSSIELYEKTGIYFFEPDTVDNVAYRLIGDEELDEPIGEMSFTTVDANENELNVTFRIHKDEMINADQAGLLFGTLDLAERSSMRISNNITTVKYNESGEAILFWHDTDVGLNCCVRFSSGADRESVMLYANLLYAYIHSDIKPE